MSRFELILLNYAEIFAGNSQRLAFPSFVLQPSIPLCRRKKFCSANSPKNGSKSLEKAANCKRYVHLLCSLPLIFFLPPHITSPIPLPSIPLSLLPSLFSLLSTPFPFLSSLFTASQPTFHRRARPRS